MKSTAVEGLLEAVYTELNSEQQEKFMWLFLKARDLERIQIAEAFEAGKKPASNEGSGDYYFINTYVKRQYDGC
jgi:hypothetical protein